MATAYTPGLEISPSTVVTKVRELPIPGTSLVQVGDKVNEFDSVLSADLPGDLVIINMSERMGLEPEEISEKLLVKVGDNVASDQLLSEVKSFFGMFTSRCKSPTEGTVEFFIKANAHLGIRQAPIPLSVNAYLRGKVIEVVEGKSVTVESNAAIIQGIFGVGGERHGALLPLPCLANEIVTEHFLKNYAESLNSKVIIGGMSFTVEALAEAAKRGVSGVVTGSIDSDVLRNFVGSDIGLSITGDEDIPFTLIITEGFGELPISERVIELAAKLKGQQASINGATQVRAGAMRPEIIVSHPDGQAKPENVEVAPTLILDKGSRVRVIRVPYFGKFGVVTELLHDPTIIATGAKVRVLKLRLDGGDEIIVPRANIELT